ncbi:unnamed protein product [Brachionus calyciflorus]|uniref:Uncharacterized protein n=1 Tax=Brachionus calyciflorus TaxID=104777 RepID=A0A814J294_9BILA|nr:unnamed protein product [Brachionus calyciflorus]
MFISIIIQVLNQKMPNQMAVNELKLALNEANIEVLHIYSTNNYGPFTYLNEIDPSNTKEHDKFIQKFKDNIYAIAKPKSESIELLQLDDKKPVVIYRPFRFLIGRMDVSANKISFLAYVPKQYLQELRSAQTNDTKIKASVLSRASRIHNEFYQNFFSRLQEESQKFLDRYFSNSNLRELALNGNRKYKIPNEILEAIQTNKILKSLPLGQFIAHEEDIELPNGQIKKIVLTVSTSYNGSDTKNYREENCLITETTENYSILYNLSSK